MANPGRCPNVTQTTETPGIVSMKSISASIITLSGAVVLVGGSFVSHNQTQGFLQIVGSVVGLIGLVVWFRAIQQSEG